MDSTLRPMSTGQALDRTFHLYRDHFLLFAGISALPPAVLLIAQVGFVLTLGSTLKLDFLPAEAVFAVWIVAVVVAYLVALSFATGATVYAVSRVHLGHGIRINESYKVIQPLLWRIVRIVLSVTVRFAGAIAVAVAVGVVPIRLMATLEHTLMNPTAFMVISWGGGLLLVVAVIVCVIWAIRLYCSYQLAVPVCVLENRGAVDCMKRSRFLSRGKGVQRILLVLFLSAVLTYILSLAFSMPVMMLAMVSAIGNATRLAMPIVIWQYLASFFAGTIAGPIATIALGILYYDERVRKEAFDLQLMMEAVGQQQAPQTAAAAAPPAFG
ncbi:MAG TPA: hypothetical protein VFF39_06550 [Verrucomicrobiae bacterium]|nr:hypothetical protein [Verrucomicrobiae bacterium]